MHLCVAPVVSAFTNKVALENRQNRATKYYNKNVDIRKREMLFNPGDAVVFRDNFADRNWKQAQIVKNNGNPRSYDIVTGNGRILNRNTKMFLPIFLAFTIVSAQM